MSTASNLLLMASRRRRAKASLFRLPGFISNWASTPDSAAISIVGDLDLRVKLAADDWTPSLQVAVISKVQSDGQASYDLVLNPAGTLLYRWTPTGAFAGLVSKTSTVATGVADGAVKWIRVTHDVDNTAVGNDVAFWTSDDGVAWTQLGATITTAGVTSIFDGSNVLGIGPESNGSGNPLAANIFRAQVLNGIGGAVVADFDPTLGIVGATTVAGTTGELWTINRSGAIPAKLS